MSQYESRAIVRADYLFAVEPFSSTEETRYYLNGVHIEAHPAGGALMVTTDGHMMAVAYDPQAIVTGPSRIYHRDTVGKKALQPIIKARQGSSRNSTVFPVWLDIKIADRIGEDSITLKMLGQDDTAKDCLDGGLPIMQRTRLTTDDRLHIDGTFPEWRRVIPRPTTDQPFVPAFYQGRYLAKAAKFVQDLAAIETFGGGDITSPMTVLTNAVNSPAIIRGTGLGSQRGFLVCMPVRGDSTLTDEVLPSWFTDPNPVEAKPKLKAVA